ncbi:MAG: DUF2860 family protein [Halioglobus sp.]
MRQFVISPFAVLVLLSLQSITANALSPVSKEPGWSGFVSAGAGLTEIKSNTFAGNNFIDGGDSVIESIDQKPKAYSNTNFIGGSEVRYTLSNQNEIFFGGSLEDILTMDFGTQLGWRKQAENLGIFQTSFLFSSIPTEVWEDPYLTGTKRKETDRDSAGLRFVWDRIMGTAFELTMQGRKLDFGRERSGSDPRLRCDLTCQSQLDRNGDQYQAWLSYTFRLGGRHIVRPQIRLRVDDRDGDAVSRDAYSLQMTYSYLGTKWTFVTNALYGQSEFDKLNPLYGQREDTDTLLFDATVLYRLPVKSGRWQALGSAFWGEGDSDISFHDDSLNMVSLGVIYNFGNQPGVR